MGNRRFTVEEYNQWIRDKAVLEKVAESYRMRIQALKDKIALLKSEIVKSDIAIQ